MGYQMFMHRTSATSMYVQPSHGTDSGAAVPGSVAPVMELPGSSDAVRSLAISPTWVEADQSQLLLACGFESGHIHILAVNLHAKASRLVWQSASHNMHAAAVRRLCWSVRSGREQENLLASCGDDHTVRVFRVSVL